MKKILIISLVGIIGAFFTFTVQLEDLDLGKVHFPRDFLHDQKTYSRGHYQVKLENREPSYYFIVSDGKGEHLFEELAVTKPYEGSAKNFQYRIHKEFLKDYEYFRIKIITPQVLIMGYFLVDHRGKKE